MLVENVHRRTQTSLGKLTPHADQGKFASAWGVVEGNAPSGWHGVGDLQDGIPVDRDGRMLMRFTEHKENGKTHDIKYHGMTLREMVVDRKYTRQADQFCAALSEEKVQREEQNVQTRDTGQLFTKQINSGYEDVPQGGFNTPQEPNPFHTDVPAPRKSKGWPKGKPRGPRKSTSPEPTNQT